MNLAEKIIAKTVEEGECLLWQGAYAAKPGRPVLWLDGKNVSLRRVLWEEYHGRPAPDTIGVSCRNWRCVAPWCLCVRPKSQELKGRPKPIAMKMRVAMTKRAQSKISEETVALIRSSDESARALALRFGIAQQTVTLIRSQQRRRDFSSPFAALAA